jgi:hypothetical protein
MLGIVERKELVRMVRREGKRTVDSGRTGRPRTGGEARKRQCCSVPSAVQVLQRITPWLPQEVQKGRIADMEPAPWWRAERSRRARQLDSACKLREGSSEAVHFRFLFSDSGISDEPELVAWRSGASVGEKER